jgi:superfamily II DNA or RNA helicase
MELLNAARQIICIRKQQHTNHMEDDIKRILQDKQFHLQLKSEQKEIIQNVLERKDSMAVLPTGFGKSMQIIWRAALSSSIHAMRCCHHSVSIARSRL